MYSSFVRLRTRGRRAAIVAAAGVVAIAAAGCSSFVSQPTGAQIAPNGEVAVDSVICLDGFGPNEESAATECTTANSLPGNSSSEGQFLIAYQVPSGSTVPSTLTSPDLGGVVFTANSNYVSWLDNDQAPAKGYEWVGYMSSEFSVTTSEKLHITADFAPATPTNGLPYVGPYTVQQVVIGDRADGSFESVAVDPSRPLNCYEAIPLPANPKDTVNATGCYNDGSTDPLSIDTRDLITTAPAAPISVQSGSTATIPFTIEYDGPSSESFQLGASTSSDALTATPADKTFAPKGTGNTTENVSVPIPAGLAPGTYTVTLNVGAFGSQVATLQVTAPPTVTTTTTTAPPVTPAATPAMRPAISGFDITPSSLKLTLRLNLAATERLSLARRRGGKWKTLKTISVKGSAGANTVLLKSLFGSLLKPAGRYRVTVQAVDGVVSSSPQSLSFVVR